MRDRYLVVEWEGMADHAYGPYTEGSADEFREATKQALKDYPDARLWAVTAGSQVHAIALVNEHIREDNLP